MASILSTIQLETTSTSGTLTSEQLATLQESKTNYIVYGTELFKLVDNNTSGDTLIYTCSTNDSGTLKVKSITVTISTLAWTYSELSSGGSSGGNKYYHNIYLQKNHDNGYDVLMFSIITTRSTPYDNFTDILNALNSVGAILNSNNILATGTVYVNGEYYSIFAASAQSNGGISINASGRTQPSVSTAMFNPGGIKDLVIEI